MEGHSSFTLLTWNIRNPSVERVKRQTAWLAAQDADFLVLTECKQSRGTAELICWLRHARYEVTFPIFGASEYGVLIASRFPLARLAPFSSRIISLASRVVSVEVDVPGLSDPLEIIGAYVPSRDASPQKKERKRLFLDTLCGAFEAEPPRGERVFAGDLNVLERKHTPAYKTFAPWEYQFYDALPGYGLHDAFRHLSPSAEEHSWVGRTGDGYRYDHCFASSGLLPWISRCSYLHEPRQDRLSDHSALLTEFMPPLK